MRLTKLFMILLLLGSLSSCVSVRVTTDYDREVQFEQYNTFAFYKPGIDEAQISDLDKKRILRAIDAELTAKGFSKSDNPNLLVSIFTKERDRVDVWNNFGWGWGWGWGWNPWWGGVGMGGANVSRTTEGSLYIDLIDAKKNELVWQGVGSARLITTSNVEKREERIRAIVSEIMATYPPGSEQ